MSNVGHQQFWVTGSRFYFQRDPIGGVVQPIIDFGVVNPANPNFEREVIQLEDSDGGFKRLVDEKIISSDESYEIECFNINADMMALLFSSAPPAELTQSATPLTGVVHYAHPGRLVKLLDGDYDATTAPRLTLGVTSVQAVTGPSGTPTYTEGTDWEVVSLERGLIRMIDGGGFSAAGEIEVDFTPRAIEGKRLIVPNAGLSTSIKGQGLLVWGRENNNQQTARIARFSLAGNTPNLQIDDYSSLTLTARVLSDVDLSEPAGRIEYWLGDLPSVS